MNNLQRGFQIFGVNWFFQRAVNMEVFFVGAGLVVAQFMADDGAETIAGSAVGADT